MIDRLAAFFVRRRDDDRFWLTAALAVTAIASVVFLASTFRDPASIQDDARMFLSWMARWDDPELLRGDLMADYWQSVSPWFFSALYHLGWATGVAPIAFAKILPPVLFLLTALFSYRLLRAMGAEPVVAFFSTLVLMQIVIHDDVMVSATPRALSPVFILAVLDGVARRSIAQTALAQLCLAGTYPQAALVSATVIGLSMVSVAPRLALDFSRMRIALVGASAVATLIGILPFLLDTNAFGPAFTLDQIRTIPTFQHGARGAFFAADGSVDRLCGQRSGILGDLCQGPDFGLLALIVLVLSGPLVLLARVRRDGSDFASPIPLFLAVASLLWAAIASAMLFRLHLPSRYSASLVIVIAIATVPLAFEWAKERLAAAGFRAVPFVAAAALLGAAVWGMATVKTRMAEPSDPALLAAIGELPKDKVVAGFVSDINFVPALIPRSALFNYELAVAYQSGYFRQIVERMEAVRDIHLTHDPAQFSNLLRQFGIGKLLVDADALASGTIPKNFRDFFGPDLVRQEEESRRRGPTVLARLADSCRDATYGRVLMLDAACLEHAASP